MALTQKSCSQKVPFRVSDSSSSAALQADFAQLVLACCPGRKEVVELASDWFSPDAAQPPRQLPAVRKQRINTFHRSGKVLRYGAPSEIRYRPGV